MQFILAVLFVIVTKTASELCDKANSVELIDRTYNGMKYGKGEYFVDNTTGVERGCICMKELCARKCCPFGQGYEEETKKCVDLPDKFDPPVWKGSHVMPGFDFKKEFHVFQTKMKCDRAKDEVRIFIREITDKFHLRRDGKLVVEMEDSIPSMVVYGADKYCIDNFKSGSAGKIEVKLNALTCFVSKQEDNHYEVSASCMLISCFFILLTVAVYAFLPELRTLHGMVLTAYLLSFFVGFLFLATMQILLLVDNITQEYCTGMTFVIYFSILAAFFWLNVMCYDLWIKFRPGNTVRTRSKRVRFLRYCAYAFGVPTLLTIILAAMEFSDLPEGSKWTPMLRQSGCFISGRAKLIYLYAPILVLCVANLVLFILTAVRLAQIKSQTKILQKKDTQRFSLYIKLFIVTGINWVLEVISSFFPEINYLWKFTDAYNVLVGLIIFIIFVCKANVMKSIKRRINDFRGAPSPTDSSEMSNQQLSNVQKNRAFMASKESLKTSVGIEANKTPASATSRLCTGATTPSSSQSTTTASSKTYPHDNEDIEMKSKASIETVLEK